MLKVGCSIPQTPDPYIQVHPKRTGPSPKSSKSLEERWIKMLEVSPLAKCCRRLEYAMVGRKGKKKKKKTYPTHAAQPCKLRINASRPILLAAPVRVPCHAFAVHVQLPEALDPRETIDWHFQE